MQGLCCSSVHAPSDGRMPKNGYAEITLASHHPRAAHESPSCHSLCGGGRCGACAQKKDRAEKGYYRKAHPTFRAQHVRPFFEDCVHVFRMSHLAPSGTRACRSRVRMTRLCKQAPDRETGRTRILSVDDGRARGRTRPLRAGLLRCGQSRRWVYPAFARNLITDSNESCTFSNDEWAGQTKDA